MPAYIFSLCFRRLEVVIAMERDKERLRLYCNLFRKIARLADDYERYLLRPDLAVQRITQVDQVLDTLLVCTVIEIICSF